MSQDTQNELEDLGEEEVRKRVDAHVWTASKERQARQWLEFRRWYKSSDNARQTLAIAKEANDIARSGVLLAAIALIAATIAIAVSIGGLFLQK